MSKGHVEALRALREAKFARTATRRVTKPPALPKASALKPAGGRPKVHKTNAARQQAYRSRKGKTAQ